MKTPAVLLACLLAVSSALAAEPVGRPMAPATPGAAAAPAPATPRPAVGGLTPGEILKAYRNSLVFVTGASGNGSGFIAAAGGANFIFTNAHVAAGIKGAGFKTLEGNAVPVGAAGIAVGHDIFRLQVAAVAQPFEIMQGVDEKAAIGDEVVVLGNAEGAGVINLLGGRIVGIGPDRVEVDAPFQPGNSGSPIIHLKSGQVIGVATYLTIKKYDPATKTVLANPIVRRFGFRLDSVKVWQPVNGQAFFAQAAEMESIEKLTMAFEGLFMDMIQHKQITPDLHTHPAIKNRINQWQADLKKKMSVRDSTAGDQNFLAFLKSACRTDIIAAQPRMTYEYFQRQLAEETRIRAEFIEIFDKIIKDIQQSR